MSADDIHNLVHYGIETIGLIAAGYWKYKSMTDKKDSSEVCEKDFRVLKNEVENLKIEIAVAKEKLQNEIILTSKSLDRISDKIDQIMEKI